MLPYLKANKISCPSFKDSGRWHKTSESETENHLLVTTAAVARISVFLCQFYEFQFPSGRCKKGQMTSVHALGCIVGQEP